jgi:hypothetical protein
MQIAQVKSILLLAMFAFMEIVFLYKVPQELSLYSDLTPGDFLILNKLQH